MASKMSEEKRNQLMFEAMRLLMDDNLVWSPDFEEIRPALAALFFKAMAIPELAITVTELARRIVKSYG